jgi:large subunit ribosomal protein L22
LDNKEKVVIDERQDEKVVRRTKSNRAPVLTKKEKRTLGVGKDHGKAIAKYVRISSRKIKIVLDLIRNKDLDEAIAIVKHTPKAASPILFKLITSAAANASIKNLNDENLYVAEAYANQGPTLKRIMPRAQGRASRINKRTSHITLVVKERE